MKSMKPNIKTLKDLCIQALEQNKADNLKIIDLSNKNSITDFIIIASGSSGRHLLTLKDKIVEALKTQSIKPSYVEGERTANWIVIDIESIIIHLFRQEVRDYYEFDSIWD